MIEEAILSGLLKSERFARRVCPHLRAEYFSDTAQRALYKLIDQHIKKYNTAPSPDVLRITLAQTSSAEISDVVYKAANEIVSRLGIDADAQDYDWLVDATEGFCQDRAMSIAIRKSIDILGQSETLHDRAIIRELVSDALSVSFDTNVGHNYRRDSLQRFLSFSETADKIPFDIAYLNDITGGGLEKGTLNVLLGGVGAGKSLSMCHLAQAHFKMGYNVLYITLELSEKMVSRRIEANLMDTDINLLPLLDKPTFDRKIDLILKNTPADLIIKQFPTAAAGAAHFRALLNELRIKNNFVPDIVYIDYLNICASVRYRGSANVNSYNYVKAIAEEICGLAVENNIAIISATQFNREGFSSSDPTMTDTAESFGLPATADFMLAIVQTDDLKEKGQYMLKQLKNRYKDENYRPKAIIGVNKPLMRLFDTNDSAPKEWVDTQTGEILNSLPNSTSRFAGLKT